MGLRWVNKEKEGYVIWDEKKYIFVQVGVLYLLLIKLTTKSKDQWIILEEFSISFLFMVMILGGLSQTVLTSLYPVSTITKD